MVGFQCFDTLWAESVTTDGYPRWDFEMFYQQGLRCFEWNVPRPLIKQAFRAVCERWAAKGHFVAMWQIRAFVHGCTGDFGKRQRRVAETYSWPNPPDASWLLVVCVYPDGICDLDLVHQVSRRFYSEDNGFISPPTEMLSVINSNWYEEMGFEIMRMQPYWPGALKVGSQQNHLTLA